MTNWGMGGRLGVEVSRGAMMGSVSIEEGIMVYVASGGRFFWRTRGF